MSQIFPDSCSENRVICVPGIGSKNPFSALITDTMPDLGFNEAAQCFPRYSYPKSADANQINGDSAPVRIDNILDTALHAFRNHYRDGTLTKDAIFDYVYGLLHAPAYREHFKNDLSKELPHIPFAPDFYAFAEAGRALAALHLNYETCQQYPHLEVEPRTPSLFWKPEPEHFRLSARAMRFANKDTKTTLIINEHIQLSGIPAEAHQYMVNGKTPLEWFMNRYKIKQDAQSGIVNDPNEWFERPRDLVTAIRRIVHVSVESTRIIERLPAEIMAPD